MRARVDDPMFDGNLWQRGQQTKEALRATLTGGFVVAANAPSVLVLDPNGAARNVDLPAADNTLNAGRVWWIFNMAAGAFALTVRNNGGATIVTVPQGKIGFVMQVGTAGAVGTAGYVGTPLP